MAYAWCFTIHNYLTMQDVSGWFRHIIIKGNVLMWKWLDMLWCYHRLFICSYLLQNCQYQFLISQKFLQTKSLNCSSIRSKLETVIEWVKVIQGRLNEYDTIDASLVYFRKFINVYTTFAEIMKFTCPLGNRVLIKSVDQIKVRLNYCLSWD